MNASTNQTNIQNIFNYISGSSKPKEVSYKIVESFMGTELSNITREYYYIDDAIEFAESNRRHCKSLIVITDSENTTVSQEDINSAWIGKAR